MKIDNLSDSPVSLILCTTLLINSIALSMYTSFLVQFRKAIMWNGLINISFTNENLSKEILVPPEYKFLITYICFSYNFVFKRIPNQHIILLFVPSILIVSLSWISFWLDVKMAGPRVALGLTSLLTLSTQFSSAQKDLPAVATIKALDIWMFVCIFMVFASLLIYAMSYTCDQLKIIETTTPVNHGLFGSTKHEKYSRKSALNYTVLFMMNHLKSLSYDGERGEGHVTSFVCYATNLTIMLGADMQQFHIA
uniref:Neurotransmitter-gated ion-channel transmembrane domain-containing protein n=1 Tax=Strigamia maritima TaxID=126957 RepID=T1J031_STRMM